MASPISIFDIPLIIDLVASYLSKRDRARCSLVSRAFHFQFQPQLWSDISIRPINASGHILGQPSKEALLANRDMIRKLNVFDLPIAGALQSTGVLTIAGQTTNFMNESHVTPPPPTIKSTGHQMKPDDDSVRSLLLLVERNTRLQTWFIDLFGMLDTSCCWMRFFKVLANHSSLTSLHIHGQEFHHGVYRALFQSLPMALETLVIRSIIFNVVAPIHFPVPPSRGPYRRLRSVHLRMCMKGREEFVFFPFLRRCPNLEELTVPLMDGNIMHRFISLVGNPSLFPALRGLYMSCQLLLKETDLTRLVQVMQGRIRNYAMEGRCVQASARQFCANLTDHWAATLESLVFGADTIISSSEVQVIATTCSRLKRLCIASRGSEYEEDRMVVSEDNVSGWKAIFTSGGGDRCGKSTTTTDWVCLDLEELQLTILDDRWIAKDHEQDDYDDHGRGRGSGPSRSSQAVTIITSQQHQARDSLRRAKDGVCQVYQQLGRLCKLRKLSLSWYSSRWPQSTVTLTTTAIGAGIAATARFDMSLESGLQYMDQLKELRELDVRGISCLNLGQQEVEWMTQNWPKLRRCVGLVHDKRFTLQGVVGRVQQQQQQQQGASERSRNSGINSIKGYPGQSTSRTREPTHIQWLRSRQPDVEVW